jgi:osmotically-inducible protein OsmY
VGKARGVGSGAAVLVLVLLLPSCRPAQKSDSAERDVEITRSILWNYRQDSGARFQDIRVTCVDGVITLDGRVADGQAAQDAQAIALRHSRGAKVTSRLQVRPR